METAKFTTEFPIIRQTDVAVVGGGPGGLGAAIMAARRGARVVLLERYGVVGGMAAVGEISPFMGNHVDGISLDAPIYEEWRQKMSSYYADGRRRQHPWQEDFFIHKEYAALAAEELLEAAGVEILYGHELIGVQRQERRIDALIGVSRSGPVGIRAAVYVDSTGDGDLAARFGCRFELGNREGYCQPMTLCFKLAPVQLPPGGLFDPQWRQAMECAYRQAQQDGTLSCPRENILIFPGATDDVVHFNTTRILKHDATDGVSFAEATRIAHRQERELLYWLRRTIPGFEQAELVSQAVQLGVRESRRIRGLAYLTRSDFERRSKFPDAIARCNYPIDIHNPTGSGTEIMMMSDREFYEIPYGCIVPADCDNLLIGSRCISVDHALHSSIRVMPPVCSLGQAAGVAAAAAVAGRCSPAELDGRQIRAELCAMGARLSP